MNPVPVPATILVVGSGAREHAICWRLRRDEGVERVIEAPGNAGHADVADVRPEIHADDIAAIVALARREAVDLVVVGPEAPLVAGLVDRVAAAGIPAFGPSAAAAAVEGSKALCRRIAGRAGVPMARGARFDAVTPALAYAAALGGAVVVKADGLAAGKGVTVCATLDDAEKALRDAIEGRIFGDAGREVVVEQALTGPEASVIAICDTTTALALPAARDHKRIGEGDTGPNTGGMGAYSPLPDLDDDAVADIVRRFHVPTLAALAARGRPFRGALYAGLMLTDAGPRLLEYNVRLGDPEAQAILPRLAVPLAPLLLAAATDRLAAAAAALGIAGSVLPATPGATVGVVLATDGYPASPVVGDPVEGIEAARASGALVFEGGTRRTGGAVVTAGGRVLTVVAGGDDLARAAGAAHAAAACVTFRGRQMRGDIGRPMGHVAAAARLEGSSPAVARSRTDRPAGPRSPSDVAAAATSSGVPFPPDAAGSLPAEVRR
jgi:phosphoribosylamine---glycine ligase